MKPGRFLRLAVVSFSGLIVAASTALGAAVTFPDKNLEAAVKAVLKDPKEGLTDENVGNVYILEATGKDIKDLTGLEKCKNLSLIKLSKNQIADLKPLKNYYLGDPEAVARAMAAVVNQGKAK